MKAQILGSELNICHGVNFIDVRVYIEESDMSIIDMLKIKHKLKEQEEILLIAKKKVVEYFLGI